jgi:hypothetical protein
MVQTHYSCGDVHIMKENASCDMLVIIKNLRTVDGAGALPEKLCQNDFDPRYNTICTLCLPQDPVVRRPTCRHPWHLYIVHSQIQQNKIDKSLKL